MVRVAHLADLHLGTTKNSAPGSEASYAVFEAAVQRILDGGFDGVIVAGDVFDRSAHGHHALRTFQAALDDWHDAGLPTAIISGNHDAETDLPARVTLPPSAHWFAAEHPETIVWEHTGTALHGQSIRERDDLRDLAAGYPAAVPAMVNIGILHTSLDGSRSRRVCAPASLATLDAAGYDYWALGHVHARLALDDRVAYAGSVYGRASDAGAHSHLEVEVSRDGVRVVGLGDRGLARATQPAQPANAQ